MLGASVRVCLVPVCVCACVRVWMPGVRDCVYSSEVEKEREEERERGCMCEGETERVREC